MCFYSNATCILPADDEMPDPNKGLKLAAQGNFDRTAFMFTNGTLCDTGEKMRRKDRLLGAMVNHTVKLIEKLCSGCLADE